MAELGQNGPQDPQAALALYEQATRRGDKFAPHHQANLLRKLAPDDQFDNMRADALDWLAAERGFDPKSLVEKREAAE